MLKFCWACSCQETNSGCYCAEGLGRPAQCRTELICQRSSPQREVVDMSWWQVWLQNAVLHIRAETCYESAMTVPEGNAHSLSKLNDKPGCNSLNNAECLLLPLSIY